MYLIWKLEINECKFVFLLSVVKMFQVFSKYIKKK